MTIDVPLVRRLVAAQFPRWSNLPVSPVEPGGRDHRTFRLGDAMSVRLPSAERYAAQVEKEQSWLPRLAPALPVPIPVPLARGNPAEGYPWPWSVYRWIPGETAAGAAIADLAGFATALAGFLGALQRIDASGGPGFGPHNFHRGGPLTIYDGEVRQAIPALGGAIDAGAVLEVWNTAIASAWRGAPVWVHGDVAAGNLLVEDGRLCAVIDFGSSGVGDPACDLTIAWTLFEGASRDAFRAALPLAPDAWARGRGWALWKALITAAPALGANRAEVDPALRVIGAVLADARGAR